MKPNFFFHKNNIYIIGYTVTNVIHSSHYTTLINNNMATDSPHSVLLLNGCKWLIAYKLSPVTISDSVSYPLPILDSSNSAANKDMMSKLSTVREPVF